MRTHADPRRQLVWTAGVVEEHRLAFRLVSAAAADLSYVSVGRDQHGDEFLQQEEAVDPSDDPQDLPDVLLPLLTSVTPVQPQHLQGSRTEERTILD